MKIIIKFVLFALLSCVHFKAYGMEASTQALASTESLFFDARISSEFNRLSAKLQQQDAVPVIVVLKENSTGLDKTPNRQSLTVQNKIIEVQQKALLAEIPFRRKNTIKRYSSLPLLAVTVDANELKLLRASDNVDQVLEDQINFAASHEFSIARIGANIGWSLGYTGASQTIAFLDNGIDKRNPLIANKVIVEACFSTKNSGLKVSPQCKKGRTALRGPGSATVRCTLFDYGCSHGTFIAALAAGNSQSPNFAGSGVAPNATILAVKTSSLLDNRAVCFPETRCQVFFDSDILRGLDFVYRYRNRLNIPSVNISLAGRSTRRTCSVSPYKKAVAKLRAANIATIIASGNDGFPNRLSKPACIAGVISVGSTNLDDVVSSFSNSAPSLSLLAPGKDISLPMPGVVPPGYEIVARGTSLPSAFVSGAWAVLKSHKPQAIVDEILNLLVNTGVPVFDSRNGLVKPRIQIDQAHRALGQ